MEFQPCKINTEIWTRKVDNKEDLDYTRTDACADDILVTSKFTQIIVDALFKKCDFKLIGTEPISYYLGCVFTRHVRNESCLAPLKYIDKMSDF